MASQPLYRYELIELAEKLDRDYYPLTELLCKNARVQAEWLKENNAGTGPFVDLCNELSERIANHLAISREAMDESKQREHDVEPFNNIALKKSRELIIKTLEDIRLEGKVKGYVEWSEMQDNLNMKLAVLNNLLLELFRIEDKDLIPLLEKNIMVD